MNPSRRAVFDNEIAIAKKFIARAELETGFTHLERAHVIGQAFIVPHAISHWLMFKVEILRRRPVAVFGQIIRIVLGILGSAVGFVPTGNTGGSDVSMFKRMPIPAELQNYLDSKVPPDARA